MSPKQFQRIKSECARAPEARLCACVSEEQGLPIFLLDFNSLSFSLFLIFFFLSDKVKYVLGKHTWFNRQYRAVRRNFLSRARLSPFPRHASAASAAGQSRNVTPFV